MKYLNSSMGQIAYVQQGKKSENDLLLIHNGGTDHMIWQPLTAILSRDYCVTAIDLPGYGASEASVNGNVIMAYSELVEEVIGTLKLSNVVLVGNCAGSATALWHSHSRNNSNIDSIILFNALTSKTLSTESNAAIKLGTRPNSIGNNVLNTLSKLLTQFQMTRNSLVRFQIYQQLKLPGQIKNHLSDLYRRPRNAEQLIQLAQSIQTFDDLSTLTRQDCHHPSMIIWGSHNRVLPTKKGRKFIKYFGAEANHIVKGGHLVMLEAPQQCAELINEFLKKPCSETQEVESQAALAYS